MDNKKISPDDKNITTQVAPKGIRVNSVNPGVIVTGIFEKVIIVVIIVIIVVVIIIIIVIITIIFMILVIILRLCAQTQ